MAVMACSLSLLWAAACLPSFASASTQHSGLQQRHGGSVVAMRSQWFEVLLRVIPTPSIDTAVVRSFESSPLQPHQYPSAPSEHQHPRELTLAGEPPRASGYPLAQPSYTSGPRGPGTPLLHRPQSSPPANDVHTPFLPFCAARRARLLNDWRQYYTHNLRYIEHIHPLLVVGSLRALVQHLPRSLQMLLGEALSTLSTTALMIPEHCTSQASM